MIRLHKGDIVVGRPLPWPVFDRDRHLVLRPGQIVETEPQLAELSRRGLHRAAGLGGTPHRQDRPGHDAHDERADTWRTWKFDDLKLPMGTRLSLQKLDPDDDGRYHAHLLGVLKDVSLIVGIPAPGGRLASFRQGQPLLMRVFTGTRVFAFTASVLFVRYTPGAYLHIECPKSVDGTEVRARHRIKVRLIAAATVGPDDPQAHGQPTQVADLSAGGARLVASRSLGGAGTEIGLAFRLKATTGEATFKVRAVIRATEEAADGEGATHGVQFLDVEPMTQLALEGYVNRIAEIDGEQRGAHG